MLTFKAKSFISQKNIHRLQIERVTLLVILVKSIFFFFYFLQGRPVADDERY